MISITEGLFNNLTPDESKRYIYIAPTRREAIAAAKRFGHSYTEPNRLVNKLEGAGKKIFICEDEMWSIDFEYYKLFKKYGYILYWENPTRLFDCMRIHPDDQKIMYELHAKRRKDNKIVWNSPTYSGNAFREEFFYSSHNCFYAYQKQFYKILPPAFLKAFREVNMFTCSLSLSHLREYLKHFSIKYELNSKDFDYSQHIKLVRKSHSDNALLINRSVYDFDGNDLKKYSYIDADASYCDFVNYNILKQLCDNVDANDVKKVYIVSPSAYKDFDRFLYFKHKEYDN